MAITQPSNKSRQPRKHLATEQPVENLTVLFGHVRERDRHVQRIMRDASRGNYRYARFGSITIGRVSMAISRIRATMCRQSMPAYSRVCRPIRYSYEGRVINRTNRTFDRGEPATNTTSSPPPTRVSIWECNTRVRARDAWHAYASYLHAWQAPPSGS